MSPQKSLKVVAAAMGSLLALSGCGASATSTPAANATAASATPSASATSASVDTSAWPDARRVAERTLVLCAVATRGFLEASHASNAVALNEKLQATVERNGLTDELDPSEAALLNAPIGTLTSQQVIDATWRLEGVAVLAWALGAGDLPAHDQASEGLSQCAALGLMSEETPLLLQLPQRRPAAEIETLATRIFGIHWRIVDARVRPAHLDFRAIASNNWSGSWDITGVPLVEDDLALRGVRIDLAEPTVRSEAESIARERHQAMSWLRGEAARYSLASSDT